MIKIKKTVYDSPEASDGRRVLVMTLWPRGIARGKVDVWMKELGAPMSLVRDWKAGRIAWEDLAQGYLSSLKGKEGLLRELARVSRTGDITLLCTDRDPSRCHRSLLKAAIEEQGGGGKVHPDAGRRKHKSSS